MRDLSDESAPTSLGEGNCVHGSYVQLGMTTVVQSLERGSDTEVGTRLWYLLHRKSLLVVYEVEELELRRARSRVVGLKW